MKTKQNTPPCDGANSSQCSEFDARPIDIYFTRLEGESGMVINPQGYYLSTFTVIIRIDAIAAEKYLDKNLSIDDLNDLIKCRK